MNPSSREPVGAAPLTFMDPADLLHVLREARGLLASPGDDFVWSSWHGPADALAELDGLIGSLEAGRLPARHAITVLFAPTGPIQEVSLSSGWSERFVELAEECDAAVSAAY